MTRMERLVPLALAAGIVAFAWFAFGGLAALLLATAKLTLVFFIIAGAGELVLAHGKSPRSRP
jgi:hypothetical protein